MAIMGCNCNGVGPAAVCWCGAWVWPVVGYSTACAWPMRTSPTTAEVSTQTSTCEDASTQTSEVEVYGHAVTSNAEVLHKVAGGACSNVKVAVGIPDVISSQDGSCAAAVRGRSKKQGAGRDTFLGREVASQLGHGPAGVDVHPGKTRGTSVGRAVMQVEQEAVHVQCSDADQQGTGEKALPDVVDSIAVAVSPGGTQSGEVLFKALQVIDPGISKKDFWDEVTEEWCLEELSDELELREKSHQFGIAAPVLRKLLQAYVGKDVHVDEVSCQGCEKL